MAYGNPDTGPGCGLGKLAWADFKREKDIAPQVLMATANGTFWSQTFGISFGTSGCTNDGKVWAERKIEVFMSATFDNVAGYKARSRRTSNGIGSIARRSDRSPADIFLRWPKSAIANFLSAESPRRVLSSKRWTMPWQHIRSWPKLKRRTSAAES